jgi:hypothetical protein
MFSFQHGEAVDFTGLVAAELICCRLSGKSES